MKIKIIFLVWISIIISAQEPIIEICAQDKSKIPFLLAVTEDEPSLNRIAQIIKDRCLMSNQIACDIKCMSDSLKKSDFDQLHEKYGLVNFLSLSEDKNFIGSRLYDTRTAQMIVGKKFELLTDLKKTSFKIADFIWKNLCGQESCFLSKISYVKRTCTNKGNYRTAIIVCDIDGQNKKPLVKSPTINVKPVWSNDIKNPLMFYSEFTTTNVRLMGVDKESKRRNIFNFDGTIVGISTNKEGTEAVYCRSGNIWHYKYDPIAKKALHTKVIYKKGKSTSPNILPNGDIIFATDFNKNGSTVCIYKNETKDIEKLTEGYAVAPNYCDLNKSIVYSKKSDNGKMQLFLFDLKKKKESQLTFDNIDKIDPCWSPCGNYVAFSAQNGSSCRIVTIHIDSKNINYITPLGEYSYYPAWSPNYEKFIEF